MVISDEGKAMFTFGDHRLAPESEEQLDKLIDRISTMEEIERIRVIGHTDRIGSEQANQRLSMQRAEAVRDYLINRGSIDPNSVIAEGRGESEPLPRAMCDGIRSRRALIQCLAPNRRVEIDVKGISLQ
jgi:OOP family OmpA-OmpF porin